MELVRVVVAFLMAGQMDGVYAAIASKHPLIDDNDIGRLVLSLAKKVPNAQLAMSMEMSPLLARRSFGLFVKLLNGTVPYPSLMIACTVHMMHTHAEMVRFMNAQNECPHADTNSQICHMVMHTREGRAIKPKSARSLNQRMNADPSSYSVYLDILTYLGIRTQ
jgi:hypothetical protein